MKHHIWIAVAGFLGLATAQAQISSPAAAPTQTPSMGNIPKEVIVERITRAMPAIKTCYTRELETKPNLRGKVAVNFIVGLEGTVTSVRVKESTLGDLQAELCIQYVMSRLLFPKPGNGIVEVSYPFLFRVSDSATK